MIEYRLIRSDRRTLALRVDNEGALVVRAPMHMPLKQIEQFLTQKADWISQKQALVHQAPRPQTTLADGMQVPYMGRTLTVCFAAIRDVRLDEDTLYVPQGGKAAQKALQWRMKRAKEVLTPRVGYWSNKTGLVPANITFGNAASRWGSMNSRGCLRLNTALFHLPMEMADYVIVHELCHMVHANHSPVFHALVRSILPSADAIRQSMKQWTYVTQLWKEPKK